MAITRAFILLHRVSKCQDGEGEMLQALTDVSVPVCDIKPLFSTQKTDSVTSWIYIFNLFGTSAI